ncbi:PTS system, glucose-specific IIBC component [Mycoplasma mycoides subsp. mycoides]|nr:PTS system, glucose-specific IIBC component [Mycoplasma mycoides subsp. mycoides]
MFKSSFKDKLKAFAANIMPTLSKLSKAFLLPIALLPIAGVFLGVGAAIAANTPEQSTLWFIGKVMGNMGDVCFGNLPVLFCISVALAYTKDSGVAAITAVVGFLVFNGVQAPLFIAPATKTNDKVFEYSLLWYKHVSNSLTGSNMGILSLNTGVLGGIFVGAIAAKCYNKFHQTQLPTAISFFSGTKLVPIITFVAVIPLSFIFMMAWPVIGLGLNKFGQVSGTLPYGTDSLIFEIVERSLVPFGLHHVFYAPLWWTSAGGSIAEGFNTLNTQSEEVKKAFVDSYNKLHGTNHNNLKAIIDIVKAKDALWGAVGDQIISQRVIGHLNILNFTDVEKLGLT